MAPREFIKARESKEVTLVDGRPYYPQLFVTKEEDAKSHDHASLISTALAIIFHDSEPPTNLAANLKVKIVTGGITNSLYCISGFKPIQNYDSILIRVFGAEGMIDRDVETSTFASLAEADIAPPYFGRFGNGRLEGWLDNFSQLVLMDLQIKATTEAIAIRLARLHFGFRVPDTLTEWHNDAAPGLWTQLYAWMEQAKGIDSKLGYMSKGDAERSERLLNLDNIEKELNWVKESIVPAIAQVAFCHNDLLPANIMKHGETGEIKLIDFEYGGVNFIGFDIANFFNEFAGGPEKKSGEPDYSLFPDEARQKFFITAYVRESRSLHGGGDDDDPNGHLKTTTTTEEEEIETLCKDVDAFVLVNHLYWGLWAVNQAAAEGTEDFDFLAFAWHRFNRFFEIKEECGF